MSDYPIYNIPQIQGRRDKLIRQVFSPLGEVTLQGHQIDLLVTSLQRNLPRGITADVLFESVRHLAGATLDWQVTAETAWRLAGNIPLLRAGYPVGPWTAQKVPEWIPVLCLQGTIARNQRGRVGYNYVLRVLAGTPCPMRVTAFWSRELMGAMSQRIGFSKPWGNYPYRHGTELVGLRIMCQIDPDRSQYAPTFSEYGASSSMQDWNRKKVLKLRKRVGVSCPRNWTHPCHLCAVGYETCRAATHWRTYVKQFCLICGEDNYFDSDVSTDRCISCAREERLNQAE